MGDTFIRHIALLGFEKRFVPSQHYVSSGDCGQMAPGLWASVDMGPLKTRQPTSLPAPLPQPRVLCALPSSQPALTLVPRRVPCFYRQPSLTILVLRE